MSQAFSDPFLKNYAMATVGGLHVELAGEEGLDTTQLLRKVSFLLAAAQPGARAHDADGCHPAQSYRSTVQMPPMTHNTKVVFPYEKDEQDKLVTAFTEEKNGRLRFRYGWGAVLILETAYERVKLWRWIGATSTRRSGRSRSRRTWSGWTGKIPSNVLRKWSPASAQSA